MVRPKLVSQVRSVRPCAYPVSASIKVLERLALLPNVFEHS